MISYGAWRDEIDCHRMNQQLQELPYASILGQLPDTTLLIFDTDLRIQLVSGAALDQQLFMQKAEPEKTLHEAMPQAYIAAFEAPCRAALTGESQRSEFLYAGHIYDIHVGPLRDEQNAITGGMAVARRLNMPDAASTLSRYYSALFNQNNDAVLIFDMDGNALDWNQRAAQMLGYEFAEFAELTVYKVIAPEEVSDSRQRFVQLAAGETPPVYERRVRRKDGTIIIAEINVAPVKGEDGKPFCIMSILRDITQRKQAEAEQRLIEERNTIISELTFDFAYAVRVDPDGTMTYEWLTVEPFERMTGYPVSELERIGFQQIYHPDDRDRLREDRDRTMKGEIVTGEYRIITRGGDLRWTVIDRYPIWDEQEQRVVRFYAVAKDITERKETEIALRASEERFRLVAKVISDGVYDWDMVRNTNWHSESYRETFAVEGAGPSDFAAWFDRIHPEDNEMVVESQLLAIQDGAESWAEEYRMRRRDGSYAIVADRALILRDQAGNPIRLIGAVTDVTERRKAEQQALDLALQREKVRILAEYITAISHDFRTPLSVINTSIYLIGKVREEEERKRHLEKLNEQATRIEELVDGLLTMARLDKDDLLTCEWLDLNTLVVQTDIRKRPLCDDKGLKLSVNLAHDLPLVYVDRLWMNEALMHLVDNAIQYTPAGQFITIRTYQQHESVVIEIQDTGIGMDEEQLQGIFDPLFRAEAHRPMTGGSGLGMAITGKIIERHNGRIEVDSKPNVGTTVRIWLTVTAEPAV
jgi:PAS domain S-box-containing protein